MGETMSDWANFVTCQDTPEWANKTIVEKSEIARVEALLAGRVAEIERLTAENERLQAGVDIRTDERNGLALRCQRFREALGEIIAWSEQYRFYDGTYETDRGDPGQIARGALDA